LSTRSLLSPAGAGAVRIPDVRPLLLAVFFLLACLCGYWQAHSQQASAVTDSRPLLMRPLSGLPLAVPPEALTSGPAAALAGLEPLLPPARTRTEHYRIQPGDTLEQIFRHYGLSMNDLHDILQADEQYLVVDVIQPDSELTFAFDEADELQALSLQTSMTRTVTYRRADDGFRFDEEILPTQWQQHIVRADIQHTLYDTILAAGLTEREAMEISALLGNKVNFQRDLRPGDTFDAVVSDEYLQQLATGERRLDALKLTVRGTDYVAILFDDGNYYDEQGNSLTPALLRYPTRQHYRVSSPFNPTRFHPVTHRFAPHNGVDLAMPSGTPVLATGDGIVTRVASHPYAGRYLVVDNDGPYSTRFLHLSKVLVHKGQRVTRGQKIALSGNTGRTTGAHLHYELRINNRPVNPLTADIPTVTSVPDDKTDDYRQLVQNYMPLLSREQISLNEQADDNNDHG